MANYFIAFPILAHDALNQVLPPVMPACLHSFVASDLHCTLAFLGHMHPDRVPAVLQALERLEASAIRCRVDQLIMLPSTQKFSALSWTFGEGRTAIEGLMLKYRDEFYHLAQAVPDTREPLAHLTIARPKGKLKEDEREVVREWMIEQDATEHVILLDRLALYTWAEDRKERQFRIVGERELG